MSVSPQAVAAFIVEDLDEPLRAAGHDPRDVSDEFDLLKSGVVDSLGMMELLMAVNDRFGLDVDYEGVNPEELTVVGPLARYVAVASGGAPTSSGR
jgi:acyl carrier protein